jgi:hypothetical protein
MASRKKERERERKIYSSFTFIVCTKDEGCRARATAARFMYIALSKKFDRAAQVAERQFPLDLDIKRKFARARKAFSCVVCH